MSGYIYINFIGDKKAMCGVNIHEALRGNYTNIRARLANEGRSYILCDYRLHKYMFPTKFFKPARPNLKQVLMHIRVGTKP